MKTTLSICILVALVASASAEPQKKSYSASGNPSTRPASSKLKSPPVTPLGTNVRGAIPAGFNGGNPLQMLNPKAPARYGTWVDNTSFDPNVPGKWKGIKLFEIVF